MRLRAATSVASRAHVRRPLPAVLLAVAVAAMGAAVAVVRSSEGEDARS